MSKTQSVPAKVAGPAQLPDFLREQAAKDAGAGVSTDQSDNLVPLIYVLQAMSPQVDKDDPSYVEGAEAGDFLFRATNTVVKGDAGFVFQPCYFYKEVVEWIHRDDGGGFVGRHEKMPADAIVTKDPGSKREKYRTRDGHELQEVRAFAGFVHDGEKRIPYVIPFASTGHVVGRGWMFTANQKIIGGKPAPLWAGLYRLTTKRKQNAKGKWSAIAVEDLGYIQTTEDYNSGKILHEAFASGAKSAEAPTDRDDGGEEDTAAESVI